MYDHNATFDALATVYRNHGFDVEEDMDDMTLVVHTSEAVDADRLEHIARHVTVRKGSVRVTRAEDIPRFLVEFGAP